MMTGHESEERGSKHKQQASDKKQDGEHEITFNHQICIDRTTEGKNKQTVDLLLLIIYLLGTFATRQAAAKNQHPNKREQAKVAS